MRLNSEVSIKRSQHIHKHGDASASRLSFFFEKKSNQGKEAALEKKQQLLFSLLLFLHPPQWSTRGQATRSAAAEKEKKLQQNLCNLTRGYRSSSTSYLIQLLIAKKSNYDTLYFRLLRPLPQQLLFFLLLKYLSKFPLKSKKNISFIRLKKIVRRINDKLLRKGRSFRRLERLIEPNSFIF